MASSQKYTLLTGATGLVGSMLMRDLLRNGERLAVLVRPTAEQRGQERIESVLQYWERAGGTEMARPVCLHGDVTDPALGLDADARNWLDRHCGRVVHNAAVVKFTTTNRQSEVWRTNLDGTRHTLDLCRTLGIREFHYLSTAYVCGTRDGVIRECELEMGQSFRNDYEHSKYLAEVLVRSADFIDPPTIYRPAVISGDSLTGFSKTSHGISAYMRLLHALISKVQPDQSGRRHVPLRLPLDGGERRNVVPVDWVSASICRLLGQPNYHGRTFHLVPRSPLTPRKFFTAVYEFFRAYGFEFCGQDWQPPADATAAERAYQAHLKPYASYEHTDPRFDAIHAEHFAGNPPCPEIDHSLVHRYLKFGAANGWGRGQGQAPRVTVWAEDLLRQAIQHAGTSWSLAGRCCGTLGLDVVGPGGGPWRLEFTRTHPPRLMAGWSPDVDRVERISVEALVQLAGRSAQGPGEPPAAGVCFATPTQIRKSGAFVRKLAAQLEGDRQLAHGRGDVQHPCRRVG